MKTLPELETENVARCTGLDIPANAGHRSPFQQKLAATWGAGQHKPDDGKLCKVCRGPIEALTHEFYTPAAILKVPVTVCDDCMTLARDHYGPDRQNSQQVDLTPLFNEECPERFRELLESAAYPPNFDLNAFRQVQAWRPADKKGLALIGPSACGKTTSLWGLFRAIERAGYRPKFLTGVELNRILARAARDLDAIEWLWKCSVLMIDDLGKERCTPAASSLLWETLERRWNGKKHVIVSTRYTGDELRARFSEPQLGGDIGRRLNELCQRVDFRLQPPA